jgi:serine/threonine protein kinase
MSKPESPAAEDDPRILAISREYLADLEAGRTPDRDAYVARCPDLAEELSECLDGIELAHSLRRPHPSAPQAPDLSGTPLGDFQIIREVGRGGMGVVYEAVQLSLGRRVALKVLPFAAALDAKHLQRFKTEAYAAAQLHHTHIVPVHAVGCERGMHFYAMQLIEGRTLADVIEELRDAPSPSSTTDKPTTVALAEGTSAGETKRSQTVSRTSRPQSRFRLAARLASEVADALDYAHEAGVIHRDIKPANLMLDACGEIWITDFGLAQVATDAGLTQSGDIVGTLRYMSPEQASGQRIPVDHRADVYSLGATLYELLTLQPVFPGQDRIKLIHDILNEEPRPLRAIDPTIPIELETIVLKATSKLPVERYTSAAEMAADLRRFLHDIPILARRPTIIDRARKWLRRHPSVIVTAVLLMLFSLIGLSALTAIVSREHAKTEKAYENERTRAQEAERQFRLARRAADEMIQLAEEELTDAPFQEGLRKHLLEAALGYYQQFISQREASSADQQELQETRDRVQRILADLAALQADRNLFLLRADSVLADLKLTDAQKTDLAEFQKQLEQNGKPGPGWEFSPDDRQRMIERARANETTIARILTPQQRVRLGQIALQCQGPIVFKAPETARLLGLSAEQKDRIRTIESQMMFRLFDPNRRRHDSRPFGGGPDRGGPEHFGPDDRGPDRGPRFEGDGPPPPGGPRSEPHGPDDGGRRPGGRPRSGEVMPDDLDATARDLMTQILEVLTPEQSQIWQTRIGPPFAGPMFFPGRP